MQQSYIEYAMSVIVSRALPDVRDGLKPVHRRVLYAMWDGGYRPTAASTSAAASSATSWVSTTRTVTRPSTTPSCASCRTGRCVTRSSTGRGNFGSPVTTRPRPRYTECKMAQLSVEMVRDIDQNTVDFKPNYDGKTLEPTVPGRFPNLLVNGSSGGIAVGMATHPPHNLVEVSGCRPVGARAPRRQPRGDLRGRQARGSRPDFPTGA